MDTLNSGLVESFLARLPAASTLALRAQSMHEICGMEGLSIAQWLPDPKAKALDQGH